MRPLSLFLKHPYEILVSVVLRIKRFVPDELYLKIIFKSQINAGYKLNLKNPQTFNEKCQWMKLYNHNPLYTTLVDKVNVKRYVADKIGEEYVIPIIGVWDRVDDIKWEELPNKFVLKCSHDSGGIVICKDKSFLDIDAAKKKLEKSLNYNYYWEGREWPYKNVPRRVFAETYMEDKFGELRDYKFLCFGGVPKILYIATERQKHATKFDFFDENFNHLPFTNAHPNAEVMPQKPESFELMKELASKLSEGIPFVRVDFYEVNGKVYFGEMTFFHMGGMKPFDPKEWDYKLGSLITLPENIV